MSTLVETHYLISLMRARRLADDQRGRLVREMSGISLRELARIIEANEGQLSKWERGMSKPRPATALRWLEAIDAIDAALRRSLTTADS
jgi:transcriptional regulator with XRE-family HTH domain